MNFFENIEIKAKQDEIVKRVAGAIITNVVGKILLLQRPLDDFMGGILELPSGNVEAGEAINQGLVREVKEETNLDTRTIGMFINSFDYLSSSGKKSRQFNFEVKVENYENIILTEHDNYVWLDYEEVRNNERITDEVKYTIEIYNYNKNIEQ